MAPVTATLRRVAPLLLGLLVAACGSTASPSPQPSPSRSTSQSSASPAAPGLTPVPGGKPTPAATRPTTTDTAWGRIWDDVPPSFPKLPGQARTEPEEPASAVFLVNGDASALAAELRTSLAQAGWAVDVGSPLEDGSVVLEATGAPTGCKLEVRFTPRSGTVTVLVLYGAACPFD
jgi:hypothetical protein